MYEKGERSCPISGTKSKIKAMFFFFWEKINQIIIAKATKWITIMFLMKQKIKRIKNVFPIIPKIYLYSSHFVSYDSFIISFHLFIIIFFGSFVPFQLMLNVNRWDCLLFLVQMNRTLESLRIQRRHRIPMHWTLLRRPWMVDVETIRLHLYVTGKTRI